jgi:hypothetical protein
MSDGGSDPFGDLDQELADDGDEEEHGEKDEPVDSGTDAVHTETSTSTQQDRGQGTSVGSASGSGSSESESGSGASDPDSVAADDLSTPAFEFDEARQKAIYPRSETWTDFSDYLDFEIRRRLRDEGIQDDTKRELHEAVLQVVQNHPDEVAEQFVQNRRNR